MTRIYHFLLIVTLFFSCETPVKFETPQPQGKKDIKDIPKQLHGMYLSVSDNFYLTINERAIVKWMDIEYIEHKDSLTIEIDSTKFLNKPDKSLEIKESKVNLLLDFKGDSVVSHYSYRDTIFEISDTEILRKFKGNYFLNYRINEESWKLQKLTLNKNTLLFSSIKLPEDIALIEQFTEVQEIKSENGDIIEYKLKPSKKELKKLLNDRFMETKVYKKIP